MPIVLWIAILMSSARAGDGRAAGLRRFLPNKSISLNILAIAAGVAFLTFALAIYDGYRVKVETMIFALNPHVMLRPVPSISKDEETEPDERRRCEKVCRAPFSIYVNLAAAPEDSARFGNSRMDALNAWLKTGAAPGVSVSRVLFEEARLSLAVGNFSTQGERPMRVLGVERMVGERPAPRVDLTFSDAAVAERFYKGAGVLLSDALANEIAKEGGEKIVPGVSRIRIAGNGAVREVMVAGIHSLGILAISQNLIIAPYEIAADMLAEVRGAAPSFIGLDLSDPATARTVATEARRALRRAEISAAPWQSTSSLFDQLELYRWIIIVTLCLAIVVTMINTFVNINILIMERAGHIGIMRAMGLGPVKLMMVFVAIGLLQSLTGTAIGYVTGILTGHLLNDRINSMVREFLPITNTLVTAEARVFAAELAFISIVSVIACLLAARRILSSAIVANLRSL